MNDDRIDARALAREHRAHIVAEPDGTLSRRALDDHIADGNGHRAFVFLPCPKPADGREAALTYARERGGAVFAPDGALVESFGPVDWHPRRRKEI